jgi:hypothetical protein
MQYLPDRAFAQRAALARLLAMRLRARPVESRVRPLTLKLDARVTPDLFDLGAEEAAEAWLGVDALAQEGLLRIEFDFRKAHFSEPRHRNPRVIVEEGAFERLAHLGEVEPKDPFARELAFHLTAEGLYTPELAREISHRAPAPLRQLSVRAVAAALAQLRHLARDAPELYLREASARVFNSGSKVLDKREEWVALVLGQSCPWLASPIALQVACPQGVAQQIVFVENLTTFERLAGLNTRFRGVVFVYSAGYRAAAARLATHIASFYVNGSLDGDDLRLIFLALSPSRWLAEGPSELLPVAFFGDLDFSGMGILARLSQVWPTMQAWVPGYSQLAQLLSCGQGHTPEAADKADQRDPGVTGCPFADTVLLPLLREKYLFVDQEAIDFNELARTWADGCRAQ